MKLTIVERIKLLDTLPEKGDFTTLKILRKLTETLSFDEKEHAALQFQAEYACPECHEKFLLAEPVVCAKCNLLVERTGMLWWNPDADVEKNIHLGEKAKAIVSEALKKLDAIKELTAQHMSLYEKFVGEEKDKEE